MDTYGEFTLRGAVLLATLTLVSTATVPLHGLDITVCNPASLTNGGAVSKPSLPNTYSVKVECNFQDKTQSVDISEYYDYPNQRAAVFEEEYGFHAQGIYSYNTNEFFNIEDQLQICSVSQLSTDKSDNWLFGYNTGSPTGHTMYSAYGALHFGGNQTEQYMGTTTVRGMLVNQWKSCLYWPSKDATMTVNWYFTVDGWNTAIQSNVPVRATVVGNIWEVNAQNTRTPRPFNHTYEFAEFRNQFQDFVDLSHLFETPSGYVCPGRKDTKPLPTPSNYFRFTSEILDPTQNTIGFIKEWYDYNMSLVRYDYKPNPSNLLNFGLDTLSEVHDWNEGVAYRMDKVRGNCTVTKIAGSDFDAHSLDATTVRIRTAKEFFYFDKTQYAYEGVKKARGIDCDVWIATRSDWPSPGSSNSTWEWYFAVNDWIQSTGHTYDFGMPIQMKLTTDVVSFIYNIYDYDEEQPSIFDFDISSCFNYTEKQDFTFKLNADYHSTVAKNLQLFKYEVLLTVHKWTNLSPLRIQNIAVDYDTNNVIVTLTVLGGAPIQGDVPNPKAQVDLSQAATMLQDAINRGSFQIPVDVTNLQNPIFLKAVPYTLSASQYQYVPEYYVAPPPSKTTYTGGQMAGLGVGMLVFAFILVFVGLAVYFKKFRAAELGGGSSSVENPTYNKE
ncbi:uncharacterized protein LOC111111618 [Crassostrea virginica]|uniref:Uncharacterized protein LOC111111618 n=1 Tax=Crassostrea virginica TaxID=6565 RepID=A0A8B8BM56_CRAVI|nr:uncharacterized protein LOC111111618 [Crassostrea virginica]